jgi:hypothetical protein
MMAKGRESASDKDLPGFQNLAGLAKPDTTVTLRNAPKEPVGRRVNLLQIRLDGPYSAALLVNRTTIALQNRQNLFSPSLIFALIS